MDSFLDTRPLLCISQQEWYTIYLPCLFWLSSLPFPPTVFLCQLLGGLEKGAGKLFSRGSTSLWHHYCDILRNSMITRGYPQNYCQELEPTRASFPAKLCVSFCFDHGPIFLTERVPIKPDWNGNEETVFNLLPCSESFRTKLQALLGRWLQWFVLWVFSLPAWSKPPHLSTACVARNFKEFHVRIHQPETIKIPSHCWQPWPERISRMQKQWLALHELCVSSATWNIAIAARNKWIPLFLFHFSSSSFKKKIIFGDIANDKTLLFRGFLQFPSL